MPFGGGDSNNFDRLYYVLSIGNSLCRWSVYVLFCTADAPPSPAGYAGSVVAVVGVVAVDVSSVAAAGKDRLDIEN